MTELNREPESRMSIRFQDCDPFAHLNNARFLDYFINAREDHLVQAYGFNLYAKAKELKCNWVVTRHQIAYLAPANLNETVLIRTSLRRYTDQAVMMEGRMYDNAGARLKALLWTEFTYVSIETGRSIKHPQEILDFLKEILLVEDGFPPDFSARERAFAIKSIRP
jgi:acyl-CoA thioester hydrolase